LWWNVTCETSDSVSIVVEIFHQTSIFNCLFPSVISYLFHICHVPSFGVSSLVVVFFDGWVNLQHFQVCFCEIFVLYSLDLGCLVLRHLKLISLSFLPSCFSFFCNTLFQLEICLFIFDLLDTFVCCSFFLLDLLQRFIFTRPIWR